MPLRRITKGTDLTAEAFSVIDNATPDDWRSFFAGVGKIDALNVIERMARETLTEHGLPGELSYCLWQKDGAWQPIESGCDQGPGAVALLAQAGSGSMIARLADIVHDETFFEQDTPQGYAARLLVLVDTARKSLAKGDIDLAIRAAVDAGILLSEAGWKARHEKDAIHGRTFAESSRKSTRKPEPGIAAVMRDLIADHPDLSFAKAWRQIPGSKSPLYVGDDNGQSFEVYRDGEKIIQVNDRTARTRTLAKKSAEKYFYEARKNFRS